MITLHRVGCVSTLVVLANTLLFAAEIPGESKPATTNVRGAQFPRVHPDGRVTFRVTAPSAQKVQIQPGAAAGEPSGLGAGPFDMTRDKDGVWTVTTPAAVPGFHYYWLLIDGVPANDASSETFFGYNKETSGVEVPEPGVDFYSPKDVPHGEIREQLYHSKIPESGAGHLCMSRPATIPIRATAIPFCICSTAVERMLPAGRDRAK